MEFRYFMWLRRFWTLPPRLVLKSPPRLNAAYLFWFHWSDSSSAFIAPWNPSASASSAVHNANRTAAAGTLMPIAPRPGSPRSLLRNPDRVLAKELRELRRHPGAASLDQVLRFPADRVRHDAHLPVAGAGHRLPRLAVGALLGHLVGGAALALRALKVGLRLLVARDEVAHLVLADLQRLEDLRVDLPRLELEVE